MLDVQYHLCVSATNQEHGLPVDGAPSLSSSNFRESRVPEPVSTDISRSDSVVARLNVIEDTTIESSAAKFVPKIRSGSYADIGRRKFMEDEHIRIDDLSVHMGSFFGCSIPGAFYAVLDGHGGSDAAAYIKRNAMRLFFEDPDLPQTSDIDSLFLKELESCHRKAFLLADLALAGECSSVSSSCGTTALTALVLGRHLMVANAGDCRAVLCRKGVAVEMSHDHNTSHLQERRRVEELGGSIVDGYLNGLSVTRALGDWELKLPLGSASPLIAEPEVQQIELTEEDEFMIMGCDGIWDVMTSQNAVTLVRQWLRRHDDPQQCARELVAEALRRHTLDNLTVIVICFSSRTPELDSCPQPRRWKLCISEEAQRKLQSLLQGN